MFEGIIATVFGLILIAFHKGLARLTVDYQNSMLKIKSAPWVTKFAQIGFIIIGAFFIVTGVLQMLGV